MNKIIGEKRIYTNQHSEHDHSYSQFILPLKGQLEIKTDTSNLTLKNDRLFFMPPNCPHHFYADAANESLVLDIPAPYTKQEDMNKLIGGKEIILDDRWKSLKHLFLSEINENRSSTAINNLFLYCYDMLTKDQESPSINYIKQHYTEDIELKTLASLESYTPSYYIEWFKLKMGITPFEYIQNLRIEKSKELLATTNFTILQIGYMIGYKHQSSFTRIFKHHTNMTPKEYRQLLNIR